MWCILVLVPKLLLRDFVTFCSLNSSSFKFFSIYFFPVCGTLLIATASRCVRTLPYKNGYLALNSFIWWCSGWTGSRIIPYTSHGISGSCSQLLPGRSRADVQIWVSKSSTEVQNVKTAKTALSPSAHLWFPTQVMGRKHLDYK